MRRKSTRRPDPRQPGTRCFDGYWHREYTVLDIAREPHLLVTVQWVDGRVPRHGTQWDWRHDRIIRLVPGHEP